MRNDILKFERIRNMRIDRNLTQREIAELLNVKQNTYSQYEIGTLCYPVEAIIKLAKFYNISADYLLGLTDEPTPLQRKHCK